MAIDKKKKEKEKVVKITDEAEKKKALDTAIAAIEKQFGKGAIMRLGEDKAMDVDAISTGSMTLDMALGIGGVPRGRIVEIYGPESSGKTTVALHVVAEAQKLGAMALFGEKYGEVVRVVTMGEGDETASIEFCGGTHLDNTAKIGLFKIVSESSVASGVRRIEAVTGSAIFKFLEENVDRIKEAAKVLKVNNPLEIVARAEGVMSQIKALEKERDELQAQIAQIRADALGKSAVDVNGAKLVTGMLQNTKADALRKMADEMKGNDDDLIVIIAGVDGEKANIVCACGKNAVAKGAHSGKIVGKVAALTGGKGGGRPESAMAGVGDRFKIDEALDKAAEIVAEFVK